MVVASPLQLYVEGACHGGRVPLSQVQALVARSSASGCCRCCPIEKIHHLDMLTHDILRPAVALAMSMKVAPCNTKTEVMPRA